jgi:hypothetical protein
MRSPMHTEHHPRGPSPDPGLFYPLPSIIIFIDLRDPRWRDEKVHFFTSWLPLGPLVSR